MSTLVQQHLDRLGLADRRPPDLYRSSEEVLGAPHASAMRLAFEDLGLAGILCVQGSPTVALLHQDPKDPRRVDRVHRALWNQGLASLLLVLCENELLAYSLMRKPVETGWHSDFGERDPRLVETLDLTVRGLEAFHLISAVESGRYFTRNEFDRGSRVDAVLLSNLLETRGQLLDEGLDADEAQALLIQITFIAYLEDREFLGKDFFNKATGAGASTLRSLLESRDPTLLVQLFARLRSDFNGDLFLTPCSFDGTKETTKVTLRHLDRLADFRRGLVDLETGQGRFWPYDFRYIPVELISALYDRFLAQDTKRQRASGAYYTPRPLADLVVDQAWQFLPPGAARRSDFRLLDPACGSGIFLVRAFQRLAEDLRLGLGERYLPWDSLTRLLERLHGWDVEAGAVRLAVFSLCVALLEEADPAVVKRRVQRGRLLPRLYGKTLRDHDFFSDTASDRFDLVLGNPPWVSRRSKETEPARRWSLDHDRPMPGGEIAWAFVWKTCDDLVQKDGLVAFLLPAMGFLLNQAKATVEARRTLFQEIRLHRVINLADLRFQLFEGAIRPTALCLLRPSEAKERNYKFDYWCPKADRHLQTTGVITLPSEDRSELRLAAVLEDSGIWKRRMWIRSPEIKLYQWLGTLPRLGKRLATNRASRAAPKPWIIGQGFQPASVNDLKDEDFVAKYSKWVAKLPQLASEDFRKWVLPNRPPKPFGDIPLRRIGFEKGFKGPHILMLQGIDHVSGRLQATYTEQDLTFRHSIQSIHFRKRDPANMKLLTAALNSSLAAWFLFHEAANPGAERSKAHEEEILRLPFPTLEELDAGSEQYRAAEDIVNLMDELLLVRNKVLLESRLESAEKQFDRLVYRYYGLLDHDIAIVEEALAYVIPSVQPRRKAEPPLWKLSQEQDWRQYFQTLSKALGAWLSSDSSVGGQVVGSNQDLVILRLWLGKKLPTSQFVADEEGPQLRRTLARLRDALPQGVSRNLQLLPDLRMFLDDELFLVKPRAMRFWLRSTALDDADAIAGYLFGQAQTQLMGHAE